MMHLSKEDRKVLCNYLTDKLLSVFQTGEYTSEQDLRDDFQLFKLNLKQYHIVLDRFLKDNPARRWHICKICGRPFIAYDSFNKMKICTRQEYIRYNTVTNEYYKSMGKSMCYMQYRRRIS